VFPLIGVGCTSDEKAAPSYRRLAEECLEIAYTLPDGERRTVLVQMAQVWQRLADERASSAAMPLFSRAEGQAAPVQQQQQIQRDEDKNE
jgi:hypothetical protein